MATQARLARVWLDDACPLLCATVPLSATNSMSMSAGGTPPTAFRRIVRYIGPDGRAVFVIAYSPGSGTRGSLKSQTLANAMRAAPYRRVDPPPTIRGPAKGGLGTWSDAQMVVDGRPQTVETCHADLNVEIAVGQGAAGDVFAVTAVGTAITEIRLYHRAPAATDPFR